MALSRGLAVCLAVSLALRIRPASALGAESEDGDSGNSLSLTPTPVPFSWRKGACATRSPCPHTHATGLWVEPVYRSGDTPASPGFFISASQGRQGEAVSIPQAILPCVAPLDLLCASAHRVSFWNIPSSLLSNMMEAS